METISHETVRQVLLANELEPWIKKQWCIHAGDAVLILCFGDPLQGPAAFLAQPPQNGIRGMVASYYHCSLFLSHRCCARVL